MTRRIQTDQGKETAEKGFIVCLFFVFLAVPLCLMLGRTLDTNTLVSWQWTMGSKQPVRIIFVLIPLLACAYVFSKKHTLQDSPWVPGGMAMLLTVPFFLTPEPVVDAGRYFLQAKKVVQLGPFSFWQEWGRGVFIWTDLPLVPFLHGLWFMIWGETRIAAQILSALFFAGLVCMTSLLGKELWPEKSGSLGGWLLLASPYMLFISPAFLVDIPSAFFLVGSLLFMLRFLKYGRVQDGLSAAIFLTMAIFTKYSLWLFMVICICALFASRTTRDRWRKELYRIMVVCVPALAIMLFFLSIKWDSVVYQFSLLTTFQADGLARWDEGFWSTFLFQIHPLILVMATVACLMAIVKRERVFLLPLTAFFVVVFLPTNRIRYLIPLLPLVCLAAARGLELFKCFKVRRFAVYGAVASSLCVASVAYLPFAQSTAFMNITVAGRFLDTLPGDGVRFLSGTSGQVMGPLALVPLMDMATTKEICLEPQNIVLPHNVYTSPLRFTWEMDLGSYYPKCGTDSDHLPQVVLNNTNEDLPFAAPGKKRMVVFSKATKAFVFRPRVAVFFQGLVDS